MIILHWVDGQLELDEFVSKTKVNRDRPHRVASGQAGSTQRAGADVPLPPFIKTPVAVVGGRRLIGALQEKLPEPPPALRGFATRIFLQSNVTGENTTARVLAIAKPPEVFANK